MLIVHDLEKYYIFNLFSIVCNQLNEIVNAFYDGGNTILMH